MKLSELQTPALVVDIAAFEKNLKTMADALPGKRMRPHVKAHKCTALAKRQAAIGHTTFCCATVREMVGMAAAGLGEDLLLANETLDTSPLGGIDGRVTVAIDSPETLAAAVRGGIREVLIDVNVGLPRCGIPPEQAGALADQARKQGLEVRGVMGYEGHVVGNPDRSARETQCADSMTLLVSAHQDVGGDIISAGGTGTFDINTWANEIQAGSYALMDTAYDKLDIPFDRALSVLSTVISVAADYAVGDCGLKSLGMDHGNPDVDDAQVFFCSDEHLTYIPNQKPKVGDRIRVWPAHIDPTVAYHERMHLVDGEDVVETWPVDLRGW